MSVTVRADLLSQALAKAGAVSAPDLIDAALVEYMRHLGRQEALKHVHTFDFVDDFDEQVKRMRRSRSEKRDAS